MQTDGQVLSRLEKYLELRGLSLITRKQYIRLSRAFLNWSNRSIEEMNEDDIRNYLNYLTNTQKLGVSTVRVRSSAIYLLFYSNTGDEIFLTEPRRRLINSGCLKEFKEAFLEYLVTMGYKKQSLENYEWTIKCVGHFMHERGHTRYSRAIGEAFLKDAEKSEQHTPGVLEMMGYVLRRFDCFMERGDFMLLMPRVSRECPAQFADGLTNYLDYMRRRGLRESTIEQKRYNIHKALVKFDAMGISGLSGISPEAIYDAFEKTSDKRSFSSPLRGFMHYLYTTGAIKHDYSAIVPSVRRNRPVPSVYSKSEIEKFLGNIDTTTKAGMRKHAVVLLALRLGLRSGDIGNLKFADVDFAAKTISIIQEKTQIPHRLELLPEVEDALKIYISMARPVSDIPNIFLSLKSPIRPLSQRAIYSFTSGHFKDSGIDTGRRKRGAHALRTTLASELVAEEVPYDAVRKILGHEDPFVIKHYVGFDIDTLRSCSISVMPVTGRLAEYMQARTGGKS